MATFHTAGAGTYTLSSSISSTATSILLTSFLEPVTGTPYTMVLLNTDIVYATIAPKTNSSEFISFTGITQNANGTATLTGVTRGLAKKYPFTTDSAYKLPHSGQSQFILSDAPQVFEKYGSIENTETLAGVKTFTSIPVLPASDPTTANQATRKSYVDTLVATKVGLTGSESIDGVKTFTSSPIVPTPTTAFQAAPKGYVDGVAIAGAPDASETVKGIVEEATNAEVAAGADTGGTGAKLFVPPSKMNPQIASLVRSTISCLTCIPYSAIPVATSVSEVTVGTNTTAFVGQVIIPFAITANKISFRVATAVTTPGTLDLSLYSEDGQTQIFSVTTASISATNSIVTTALSAVVIPAGVYYILVNPNSTASVNTFFYLHSGTVPFTETEGLPFDIASEPVMEGTLTITAGTPPATFTPSSITGVVNRTLIFRLDN